MTGRCLYIGNWRPSHSTENHVATSLRTLGWDVAQAQEDECAEEWGRLWTRAHEADLVIYTKTHSMGLPRDKATTLWQSLAAIDIPTVSYHLDKFFGLKREAMVRDRDPLFTVSNVFTADGDENPWARYGVRHSWLRAGVLADECKPGRVNGKWAGYDVAFVGTSIHYHREWRYREQMLGALKGRFGDRLLVLPNPTQPAVRGWALNDLYATVPVIVGDSLAFKHERSLYWSDRAYETCGRGGFLVHPRIDALREELLLCDSIRWYEWGEFDSLCDQVADLVALFKADPERRALTTTQGSNYVRDHCTYTHRMIEMLRVLDLPFVCPPWMVGACQ